MTFSPWIIYLWGIADGIGVTVGLLTLLSGLGTLAITLWYLFASVDGYEETVSRLPIKTTWAVFTALIVVNCLLPSSKTIAVMVVVPAIINSEPIQKGLPELYKAAKDALMGTLDQK